MSMYSQSKSVKKIVLGMISGYMLAVIGLNCWIEHDISKLRNASTTQINRAFTNNIPDTTVDTEYSKYQLIDEHYLCEEGINKPTKNAAYFSASGYLSEGHNISDISDIEKTKILAYEGMRNLRGNMEKAKRELPSKTYTIYICIPFLVAQYLIIICILFRFLTAIFHILYFIPLLVLTFRTTKMLLLSPYIGLLQDIELGNCVYVGDDKYFGSIIEVSWESFYLSLNVICSLVFSLLSVITTYRALDMVSPKVRKYTNPTKLLNCIPIFFGCLVVTQFITMYLLVRSYQYLIAPPSWMNFRLLFTAWLLVWGQLCNIIFIYMETLFTFEICARDSVQEIYMYRRVIRAFCLNYRDHRHTKYTEPPSNLWQLYYDEIGNTRVLCFHHSTMKFKHIKLGTHFPSASAILIKELLYLFHRNDIGIKVPIFANRENRHIENIKPKPKTDDSPLANIDTTYIVSVGGGGSGMGVNTGTYSTECYIYDIYRNKWSRLPSLRTPRMRASVISFQSEWIYCFGGCFPEPFTKSPVERLNINTRADWEEEFLSSGQIPDYPMLSTFGGHILMFGGHVRGRDLTYTLAYSTRTGSVRALPSMPSVITPLNYAYTSLPVNSQGYIYLMGGKHLIRFDMHTCRWSIFEGKWVMTHFVENLNLQRDEWIRPFGVFNQ